MIRPARVIALVSFTLVACWSLAARAEITVEKTDKGATVKIDGQLFTEFLSDSGGKPILYPIIGPTGKPMTRPYPMEAMTPGGTKDHQWHRSMYFAHGWVNGVDFWTEHTANEGKKKDNEPGKGKTVQKEIVKAEGGKTGTIVTRDDWIADDGTKVAEDERTYKFSVDGDSRIIDFDIKVTASNGPLTFGDTKEGTFAIRVADSMRGDAKTGSGEAAKPAGGEFVNSDGKKNKDVWGRQASWVDYHGPVEGETLGIAVLNHPTSYKYPTYWQVRGYGLFAVNPFGLSDYEMELNTGKGPPGAGPQFATLAEANARKGTATIDSGKSATFRYRVILHKGDEKDGKIAEAFEAYSKQP